MRARSLELEKHVRAREVEVQVFPSLPLAVIVRLLKVLEAAQRTSRPCSCSDYPPYG